MRRLKFVLGILISLCICPPIVLSAHLQDMQKSVLLKKNSSDTTPPEISSVTVATNGVTVAIVFTESVVTTLADDGDFYLYCSVTGAPDPISLNSITGSGSSRTLTSAATIQSSDSCVLYYGGSANEIEDAAGNDLSGTLYDFAVTNNSTQGSCADSSCSGFLTCQNFEGTGYDNSETWTESVGATGGVVDEDYATSPGRGSQSLRVVPGSTEASYTYPTFSAQTAIYGHFRMYVATAPSANDSDVISTSDAAVSQLVAVLMNTDRTLKIAWMGLGSSSSTSALDLNTWYHIWYYMAKGTGANAQAWLRISTSTTMPATNDIAVTTGAWTTDRIASYPSSYHGSGSDIRFDQWLVISTPIGDVCE